MPVPRRIPSLDPCADQTGLRAEVTLDEPVAGTASLRLSFDCVLPMPVDEVLLRRLRLEVQAVEPDPHRLLRWLSRLLETGGGRSGPRREAAGPSLDQPPRSPALMASLTPRERCVVLLAAEGLRNKEIARRLCRSVRTVECQISSALRKLQVGNRVQLLHALESARAQFDPQTGVDAGIRVPSSISRKARAALESVRPPCTT